jgi:NAD(P)-dependent dehydrogenase (short-subunit alcohol dehydrogenase family)
MNGRVVLITGGARGVGAEVARRLHAKGAKLALTDLDEAPLKELAGDLGDDRVQAVVADVRDLSAMQAAVNEAVDRFGGIDIVMANAGIATYGSVLQVDPDAFKTLMGVNVVGVFHTVRAALPSVIDRRGYVLDRVVAGRLRRQSGAGAVQRCEGSRRALRQRAANGGRAPRRRRRLCTHVMDRHPAGARQQSRPADVPGDVVEAARAAEQDHVGRGVP